MQYDLNVKARQTYRTRSLRNLLRMGHCAPTVMQTLLEITQAEQKWLVKLTAGMPGGIGNTGFECGGLTAPLIILGLRHGLNEIHNGLPRVFDHGYTYYQRFFDENAASLCKQIQNPNGFPARCIHAVCSAPELLAETLAADNSHAIPSEIRKAYARLYGHLLEQDFHCAHAVFRRLIPDIPVNQELFDATCAYLGGTLFRGMTCSAFTAGVMAIGLKTGQTENSYWRVIRLLLRGMDISDENANNFHRTINTGHRLAQWLAAEVGSTQCQSITQCDFASITGVERYIANGGIAKCRQIASQVAEQVQNNFVGELERTSMYCHLKR